MDKLEELKNYVKSMYDGLETIEDDDFVFTWCSALDFVLDKIEELEKN